MIYYQNFYAIGCGFSSDNKVLTTLPTTKKLCEAKSQNYQSLCQCTSLNQNQNDPYHPSKPKPSIAVVPTVPKVSCDGIFHQAKGKSKGYNFIGWFDNTKGDFLMISPKPTFGGRNFDIATISQAYYACNENKDCGGFSKLDIPNEPQRKAIWYYTISGIPFTVIKLFIILQTID
eukprot:Pgem_evm2s16524